jgi:hypothetical protein
MAAVKQPYSVEWRRSMVECFAEYLAALAGKDQARADTLSGAMRREGIQVDAIRRDVPRREYTLRRPVTLQRDPKRQED